MSLTQEMSHNFLTGIVQWRRRLLKINGNEDQLECQEAVTNVPLQIYQRISSYLTIFSYVYHTVPNCSGKKWQLFASFRHIELRTVKTESPGIAPAPAALALT
jgi:hypothetical protein